MGKIFEGKAQTLENILKARDIRVIYQQYLLNKYGNTIISYKLNIPGPIKYNSLIKKIFDEGLLVFKQKLEKLSIEILEEKIDYRDSGPEYFAAFNINSNLSSLLIKELATHIEQTHPLGRLYDFDILDPEGKQLGRQELGKEPRKCLLCEKNAFECGRSRSHEINDLVSKIESMALDYFNVKEAKVPNGL